MPTNFRSLFMSAPLGSKQKQVPLRTFRKNEMLIWFIHKYQDDEIVVAVNPNKVNAADVYERLEGALGGDLYFGSPWHTCNYCHCSVNIGRIVDILDQFRPRTEGNVEVNDEILRRLCHRYYQYRFPEQVTRSFTNVIYDEDTDLFYTQDARGEILCLPYAIVDKLVTKYERNAIESFGYNPYYDVSPTESPRL